MAKNHRIALHFLIGYVVGYQTLGINDEVAGGATSFLCTIPAVGLDRDATTLAEFKITPPETGLTGELSIVMNTFDTAGQVAGEFAYLDEVNAAMMGVDPGWYTFESVVAWTPESADSTIIPFGCGVQIMSDCGGSVTFAGEVAGEVTFVVNSDEVGGVTTTGNCSPVNRTLSDISITPPEAGLTGELSIVMNMFNAEGQVEGEYAYLDETNASMMGVEPGWYTFESVVGWVPESAGETPVAAGDMFQIMSDCGAMITIPSPLN